MLINTTRTCGYTQLLMSANPTMQESFADLFEASLTRQEMRQGEVITAQVVRIDQNFVVVNAGLKSESYIDREEFLSDAGEIEVAIGDFVQVAIEQLENGFGETRLGHRSHTEAEKGKQPAHETISLKKLGVG